MPLHSCENHAEDRVSYSESIWPQYKLQEHSGMKSKERIHVKRIVFKKENN